jgi:hypothetical protein
MNDTVISRIADAIAFAEGYFVSGSRPHRNNNPGDLERDLISKGSGWDGPYVIYATPQDGQQALIRQVRLMFEGSHIYKPSMTIAEVARHYTATEPEIWARNVASRLGVTVNTRLEDIARSFS